MIQFIEIAGEMRPVRFGFAGLYRYEKETGRKALADFAEMQNGLAGVSIVHMIDLVHAGLVSGYKQEGRTVDFTVDDVADWVDDKVLTKALEAFALSFPPDEGNGQAGKPRRQATPTK